MEFDNLSDLEKIFQDLSEEKTNLDELRKYFLLKSIIYFSSSLFSFDVESSLGII